MKFGVLLHQYNKNIGDDVQAYAVSQFLPSVDCFIDRETIDTFKTEDGKPIAVPMCAWYMWHKWNWPPSDYIVPKLISMHYADHELANQPGSPFKHEFLTGIGGEYLNAWGPVGTRDMFTKKKFDELGIETYFSGCVTCTLPKQPIIPNVNKYICLVDVDKPVIDMVTKQLDGTGVEIKIFSHMDEKDGKRTWEDRKKQIEKRLTIYQNAVCVLTKRLHCGVPCLAMEVPVLLVKEMDDDIRFDPYYDWFYWCKTSDFKAGKCEYDILNPPANKGNHLEARERISNEIKAFVEMYKDDERTVEEIKKTTYTEQDIINWRHDVMKKGMDNWFEFYRNLQVKKNKQHKNMIKLKKESKTFNAQLSDKQAQLDKALKEIESLKKSLKKSLKNSDKKTGFFKKK